jgi:hypothetical protein
MPPLTPRDHARKMAEDVLSAAKSVFHAVLPGAGRDTADTGSEKFAD